MGIPPTDYSVVHTRTTQLASSQVCSVASYLLRDVLQDACCPFSISRSQIRKPEGGLHRPLITRAGAILSTHEALTKCSPSRGSPHCHRILRSLQLKPVRPGRTPQDSPSLLRSAPGGPIDFRYYPREPELERHPIAQGPSDTDPHGAGECALTASQTSCGARGFTRCPHLRYKFARRGPQAIHHDLTLVH